MVTGAGLDLQEFAVLRPVERPAREAFLARWFSPGELASALAFGPGT